MSFEGGVAASLENRLHGHADRLKQRYNVRTGSRMLASGQRRTGLTITVQAKPNGHAHIRRRGGGRLWFLAEEVEADHVG